MYIGYSNFFLGGGEFPVPPPPVLCINPDKAAELTSQCGTLNLILGGGGGEGGYNGTVYKSVMISGYPH